MSGGNLKDFLQDFNSRRIFLNSVDWGSKKKDLKKFFDKLAPVDITYIRKIKKTNTCTGIVIFKEEKDAKWIHDYIRDNDNTFYNRFQVSYKYMKKVIQPLSQLQPQSLQLAEPLAKSLALSQNTHQHQGFNNHTSGQNHSATFNLSKQVRFYSNPLETHRNHWITPSRSSKAYSRIMEL